MGGPDHELAGPLNFSPYLFPLLSLNLSPFPCPMSLTQSGESVAEIWP